ncbi:protein kinase domain-containing protein [Nostoc sp.]|uniref:protein kinase domain-containing protein n=1 Tax=Nostoc sp. TaxID=1180 RepID=UPI002FF0129F
MVYCINHLCNQRHNPNDIENCLACGNPLLINKRIRLLRPLCPLNKDPYSYTEVFEVEDSGTTLYPKSQVRVMKVLKWSEHKLIELIREEALALQVLKHPGIPDSTIDDYLIVPLKDTLLELHCLVMQKIEGENLREWLKAYGRIPQSVAFDWFSQLINILDVVHRSGFFHRDIKPENIIHQPDGKLVLIDFGAARQITRSYLTKISTSGGTSTGLGSGHEITSIVTPFFTSSEQINGQGVPQSDFFALGRTFVNLVTGIPLMDLPQNQDNSRLIWRDKARHIDKPFADLLDDLMAPAPGQRPQSTQIILERLKKLPIQNKIYRLTKSKVFITNAFILGGLTILFLVKTLFLPWTVNYLVSEGEKLEAADNSQSAQKYFDLALKINSQSNRSISSFYFDKAARNINNPNLAKKYYELSIKYNDRDADALNNLALICQQLNEVKCVKDNYRKVLKLMPGDSEGHYGLGSFYDDQGKYDLAEKEYLIAKKLNTQSAYPLNNLARLKNLKGDYEQATKFALEGLTLTENPEIQAALYKNLGWASLMQKKLVEASKYLEKATQLDSERIDAFCLLAQVYEAQGKDSRTPGEVCLLTVSSTASLPEVQEWRQKLLDRVFNK